MEHVMLDLETMGTRPTSAITAIGAVMFDPDTSEIGAKWYGVVNLASCMKAGLTVDGDTIMWWLQQSDEARQALAKNPVGLDVALLSFSDWARDNGPGRNKLKVWGNGSDFDNVILGNAYRAMNYDAPWLFSKNRCFRTVKNMAYGIQQPTWQGTAHNALDDALFQAQWLLGIAQQVRIK